MMRYLLDTNIVSDLVRDPQGQVFRRIEEVGEDAVCTSIIVACELRFGAAKRRIRRLAATVDGVLQRITVLPYPAPADETYAQVRAALEGRGRPISANDLLIAAHAATLGYTLVTDNEGEFRQVRGLAVENWLRPRS